MNWFFSLFSEWRCSVLILAGFIIFAIVAAVLSKHGKKFPFAASHILFVGTFLAAVAYFLPWYRLQVSPTQAVLVSIQHSFRLFGFDGDFVEKVAGFKYYPEGVRDFFVTYGSFLYAFAPIISLSFLLSFFKNLIAHLKYSCCFWTTVHAFSELNEKTLALATSINKEKKPFLFIIPRHIIVFTDIIDKKDEQNLELIEKARSLGAVLFRKDIESIRFRGKFSLRKIKFYLISEDEAEKIRHAESIMTAYDFNRVELRVFSDDIRTELLMTTRKTKNIKVSRINDIQSLIYDNLDKNGINLFKRARRVDGEEGAIISAVIVGLGKYGCEMLKALSWYGQLEGYKLKINAFDADIKAEERFKELCPELMDSKHNKHKTKGEPYYEITIHSGVDVAVPDFEAKLKKITDATYIFVCLGEDEINLDAATKIRAMCERIAYEGDGRKPAIETVIYDSNVKKRMCITWEQLADYEEYSKDPKAYAKKRKKKTKPIYGATNFKNQPYGILMIGDLENFYSYDTVIKSELIEDGEGIHIGYTIDYEKLAFTENKMMSDWLRFVADNGLEETWSEYLSKWKEENEIAKDAPFNLFDARSGFSFMTLQEAQRTDGKLADSTILRMIAWERIVAERFEEFMLDKTTDKEWGKIVKRAVAGAKKSFLFGYNYRSSIAKAIHKRLREALNFKQELCGRPVEDLSLEQKVELGKIEHVRWNAYMRSEGYSYSAKRNDLGKVHHNLVPVSKLSNDDLRKDA